MAKSNSKVSALSVDGSSDDEGNAGTGMILMNSKAIIFTAYKLFLHRNDAMEAEIGAIMEGISLAMEWCDTPVVNPI